MLKKKLNIFKLLLLSLLIVSCNNKRDNEKLEIFETKSPNKENDLIPQNILQRTASSFKLDEEIKSDKNLSQESKISQNFKLDLEVDKNIINTLQNKNFTSAPIIGKKKLLKLQDKTSIVEIKLITGRKHQIRIQFTELGNPVMGDPRYGKGNINNTGLALIASKLVFDDPWRSGNLVTVELPEDKRLY